MSLTTKHIEEAIMGVKRENVWRMRDGKFIKTADMTHSHLANALRMVARSWRAKGHTVKTLMKNSNWKELEREAHKRRFHISYLDTPTTLNGRTEWVEIHIPSPRSRIAAAFFPADLDDRLQEE